MDPSSLGRVDAGLLADVCIPADNQPLSEVNRTGYDNIVAQVGQASNAAAT